MEQEKKSYKSSLNLPATDFSLRAKAKTKEPEVRAYWDENNVDTKVQEANKGKEQFIFHDGPPYANGHIHMGTTLNKVLKDIVAKSKRMAGKQVNFIPGWDCHGLPIELKVSKENPPPENPSEQDRVAFKKLCREFAQKWIDIQRDEFKNLGVLADWENYYATMNPIYEADIVRSFARFVEQGFIERKGKTVPWCASCQTVLATAEIEHKDRKDPSVYFEFPLGQAAAQKLGLENASLLAWTTTPWTIPLNRAVLMHPTAEYVVLEVADDKVIILAAQLADVVCTKVGIEKNVLKTITASELQGTHVHHPIVEDQLSPIILDNSVFLEQGTACVHSAPGCGPEDYVIGVQNGLEIYSPLSADGTYTEEIEPADLSGMSVQDGQWAVLKILKEKGRLFHKESIHHAYPHCWRCKNGLMFRATDQWFCNLEKNDLVKNTIKALDKVAFVPDWGINRLQSSIANRTEWCISRQRQWGTPIVALYCALCDKPYLNAAFINLVADGVEQHGIEYWDTVALDRFKLTCDGCGNADTSRFKKERDILDVWFDSGVSHHAVLDRHPELYAPADLYLEGSDQHRGWFQSSVLTSMVLRGEPAMKTIATHGYVVDAKGHKMSKSVGNVIAPQEVIDQYSTDILRLWVASTDFEKDIVISEKLLKNVAEVYRKIRNTCRFILANLYDYDVQKDAVALSDLKALDTFALRQLRTVSDRVRAAYDEYSFTTAYQEIANYCTSDLSSFYLDIIKDRLYVEKADGRDRRSAQTVIYHILDVLVHLVAPMLSYLAEEVSIHLYKNKNESIHLGSFIDVHEVQIGDRGTTPLHISRGVMLRYGMTQGIQQAGVWGALLELRSALLKAIEKEREAGTIKHSLEAKVTVHLDHSDEKAQMIRAFLKDISLKEDPIRFLKDWLIISGVELIEDCECVAPTQVSWACAVVDHADGLKCPRCWHWEITDHPDGLCRRCADLV